MIKLPRSKYFRNVFTLLSSAVIAQLLALLLTPVLTRVYSPEAFGFFNAFVSYSATMALFLFFSIELAIVRPKSQGNLNRVLGLLIAVGVTSAIVMFISIYLESDIYSFIGFDKLFNIKYFVFIGIICAALNLVLSFLVTRLGIFSVYAKTQVTFVIMRFIITISLFYMGFGFYGLILGFIVSTILNIGYLAVKTKLLSYKPRFNILSLKATAFKYKDLLLYNTPASIINTVIVNFPIFFIFKYYSVEVAGFFGLAYRMILMPVSLVNKAIGQVLYKEFIDNKNKPSYLLRLTLKNVILLSMSFPAFLVLYVYGEEIFLTIFGSEWGRSGKMASLLSPYVFLSLIVSPISCFFVAFDKNKLFSIINGLFLIVLCFSISISEWGSAEQFIEFYTLINMFYYLTIFFMIMYGIFKMNKQRDMQPNER